MKKIISLVLISLVLSGCMYVKDIDNHFELNEVINIQESEEFESRTNNFSDYVSYYLPSDMSEIDSDLTTFVFRYNDSIILYNINIADIINQKYYPNKVLMGNDYFYDDNYLFLEHSGNIKTVDGDDSYIVKVYEIEDEYLFSYSDISSQIYAYSSSGDAKEVLRHIFILARNARIESEKVITTFSDKDVISATKKTISLFNYVYPSSGYLSDLMNSPIDNNENNSQNNNIDNNYYEDENLEEEFEEN